MSGGERGRDREGEKGSEIVRERAGGEREMCECDGDVRIVTRHHLLFRSSRGTAN